MMMMMMKKEKEEDPGLHVMDPLFLSDFLKI
jgi:hypothetical protein